MCVGYQIFQAGSPDGYLDFGVISTPGGGVGDVSGVSKVKSWSGGEMLLEVLNESRMFLP